MRTECEYCGRKITLDTYDSDGVLIGAECVCGEYVTRYTREFRDSADWL